jgi:O-antigen/teichoic acid export membrane protein
MPIGKLAHAARLANDNKGRIVRALGRAGKHGFWALADQGVASLGSFGIFFILGRAFARRDAMGEFGKFGMLFELMWFLNSMHAALVIYPLSVKGATTDRITLARMAGVCVILTLVTAPLIGGAALGTATIISTLGVGAWAAAAAVTWQIQETTRRALMAELRFRDAIVGDAIRYLGHVGAVALLARTSAFTLSGVFMLMTAASLLGAAVQAFQLRLRVPGVEEIVRFAREAWVLGRWVLAGNASGVSTNFLFSTNFYYWWGAETVGIAFALNNLLRFTNPILFAVSSLITPHAARARVTSGLRASKRELLKFGALGVVLLAPYLGFVALFPSWCIRFATKPEYQLYWLVLVISVVTQALIYIGQVLGVYLNAIERNRRAFIGQILYATMFTVVGMPLCAKWGLMGAALGGLFAASALVAANLWAVETLPEHEEPAPPPPPDKRRGFDVIPVRDPEPAPITPAA